MLAAVIVLAVACAVLLAVVLAVALRPPAESARERLLQRDVDRLQRALAEAHDKLLYVVGKEWTAPPAALEEPDEEPEPDPWEHFRSHDELDEDVALLLEPRDSAGVGL